MDFKKIIESYKTIKESYGDCIDTQNENYQKLLDEIKSSIQNNHDKSFQKYSQDFSELFELWLLAKEAPTDINILPYDEQRLDKKYKEYAWHGSNFDMSLQDDLPIENDKKHTTHKSSESSEIRKNKEANLLDILIPELETLPEEKDIIRHSLNELWSHIFKNRLEFLSSKSNVDMDKYLKTYEDAQENWLLYELINQISKTIDQIIRDGKIEQTNYSGFTDKQKSEIFENTDELCKHILKTYIPDLKHSEKTSPNWTTELETFDKIQLSHIIATSDLVSYIFECRLMTTKSKNNYLEQVRRNVEVIYNTLMGGNVLYEAIEVYINRNNKEIIVINYKDQLLSPRTVFAFVISVIQEVVRRALTQSRNNIFYNINKQSRDKGLDEKWIMDKIKKDAKAYMKIIHYFDKPVSETIKKKEKNLNKWLAELNKLRFGVLDDYLFDLAKATQISFNETTQTSISTKKS